MAKLEDDHFNFEETNLPGEGSAQVELADEEAAASPVMADDEAAVEEVEETKEAEAEKKKDSDKLHFHLVCAGAAAIPLLLIILALAGMIYIETAIYAIYAICLGLIPFGLWMARRENTIFIMFLGCSLAAILTAVYCLWIELGRYNFDIRAKEAKQRSVMTLPASAIEYQTVNIASTV